jgi:Mrp family chromosome partitioning ATPase
MQAPARSHGTAHDEMEVREEILRDLRARAIVTAVAQPRLSALAAAIARTSWNPPATPRPSPRPPPGPDAPPDAIDFNTALRQHNLRTVAQSLATQAEQPPFQPDRAIVAARAWLAAGEPASARRFARLVVDDASAPDDVRIMALEILDTTPRTYESVGPMPAPAVEPPPAVRQEVDAAPRTALAVRPVRSTRPPQATSLVDGGLLDPRLVLVLEPDSERSASFRLLRDSLLARKAPRIIAVSSGAMHEGKTTCAINLALALSERPSTRVLLMDANFFAPSLGGIFHIDSTTPPDPQMDLPWLPPYRIAQMMRGFYVAALVRGAGEPAPTFNGRWFDMVIDHVSSADYDHVVIDAAALDGSPAVAQVLGVAEGTLLTVRSRTTTARALRRAAEQIPAGRALGVTLMDGDS